MTYVHHFSFTVSDLERSVDFYATTFGFTRPAAIRDVTDPWIGELTGFPGAHLRIGFVERDDAKLELIQYVRPEEPALRVSTAATGAPHMALAVDDADEALRVAEANGANRVSNPIVVPEGPWKGRRVVYLRDPDGIPLELVEGVPKGG
jgi:catechol 2,3-dioxygenase-like lactoylglutathione lyase family enzyme